MSLFSAHQYLFEKISSEINVRLRNAGLKEVYKFYDEPQPISYARQALKPTCVIYWVSAPVTKNDFQIIECSSTFKIYFEYPIDMTKESPTFSYITKYIDVFYHLLVEIQHPLNDTRVFEIVDAEQIEPELTGNIYWIGFIITCNFKRVYGPGGE